METKAIATDKKFQNIFEHANATKNGVCPVRDIIARISDKWTLLSIYALGGYGKMRFNELKHRIGDVSQRMLTVTLRNLESDGLVLRKVYPEVPPRVEYELTDLGLSLMHQMEYIIDWANTNSQEIIKRRKKVGNKK
ncbi:winged helix-turn-helix transcriptional regulator [Flavobacterium sedimenticola]|uniref:Helix-turn-helix domain-containing protein n=1 Tax=Flavobacterium sedimenticola TaxID=3043286 RepID=A0ABT6XS93_9FLAO|nr:helix-turn-helix domain-containing protein [Flavobacterium sedimenticola]MDI9257963.1 helix-turn-helix domain-containing protein [Flavobacterium sedimenticola]